MDTLQADQLINDIPATLAARAFAGTSFVPEKRGESHRQDYVVTMVGDYEELKRQAVHGGTLDKLEGAFARYRAGYAARYCAWLHSQGRCISWVITGPAGFPSRRAQKWNAAADGRMRALIEYRERVRRAIVRELRPDLRPIMAGDADAVQRLAVELAALEREQALMKRANTAIRQLASDGKDAQLLELVGLGMSPALAEKLITPGRSHGMGFPSYKLTNNGANIRRVRARLERLETMHALPVRHRFGEGVRLEEDPPANRLRLFFDDKPDAETRGRLKGCGFRWTPTLGAWQAYINPRTLELARSFEVTK